MSFFRRYFCTTKPQKTLPENVETTYLDIYACVVPKMHILEDHIVPWKEKYKVGMALHGEQGGEGAHATFNALKRNMAGIKNPMERLKSTLSEHLSTQCIKIFRCFSHP